MVAAHEPFVAHRTREPLLAGVRAQMALQLVGTRESFAAKQPIAHERSFAGVPSQVRLQVARLAVHLAAAGNVATVDVLLAQMHAGRSKPFGLLAVGTVAGSTARVAALRTRRRCLRCRRCRIGGVRQSEAADRLAGQHFVRVLQQMLTGAQKMGGVGQRMTEAGVVAGRCIVGHGGMHAGAAHLQPGTGGAVHVPPAARLYGFGFVRLRHGVEWPVVVVTRVDRA